jgi:hypothetical protein
MNTDAQNMLLCLRPQGTLTRQKRVEFECVACGSGTWTGVGLQAYNSWMLHCRPSQYMALAWGTIGVLCLAALVRLRVWLHHLCST